MISPDDAITRRPRRSSKSHNHYTRFNREVSWATCNEFRDPFALGKSFNAATDFSDDPVYILLSGRYDEGRTHDFRSVSADRLY